MKMFKRADLKFTIMILLTRAEDLLSCHHVELSIVAQYIKSIGIGLLEKNE